MKNKGWIMIIIVIYNFILTLLCNDLQFVTTGGDLLDLPTKVDFFTAMINFIDMFISMLTFQVEGLSSTVTILVVYLPNLILLTVFVMMISNRD